ncbi:MAG TPA: ATP-dependent DNA helicase [Symbiobacteriaceae bacterium]|nr:ATP-dependent DNA helicase [Symbiobacteriaceae bacterium]
MQISWTKLPFPARSREEFSRGLTGWLGWVFYETLPERGYEIREEQIYTAFRMARTLTQGGILFAEAGPGTGKTFAYLLPAVCYARFRGKPVVVASASGMLQTQLANSEGDIQTLSRMLDLQIDARLASDPGGYICLRKVDHSIADRRTRALLNWARRTGTGARTEVPDVSDEVWAEVAWDPTLACDTCKHRGTCHMMAARRHYRAAADLIVTDHRLWAWDLYTREDRQEACQLPLIPAYSAVILDEGHHMPEMWQRIQGYQLSARRLKTTLELISGFAMRAGAGGGLAEARRLQREILAKVLVAAAQRESDRFLATVLAAAEPGEGKRHVRRDGDVADAAGDLVLALEAVQDELVTEEAMLEGTDDELTLRAYQARLDDVIEALALFRAPQAVPWVEGEDLWVVPRSLLSLTGPGHLPASVPVLFSSATLEPAYGARVLGLTRHESFRVGVPFNLAVQVLVYQPSAVSDEVAQVVELLRNMRGRTLVLLSSLGEVRRYKSALQKADLPYRLLFEGDADRGAMLEEFRDDVTACLIGATFWEGVDVPGESLSCVAIPRLPFPAHDPLIRERRAQAADRGEDPFLAVDLPEMLLKLKQGAGRLIRTARDRGVLALLDGTYSDKPWAESVAEVLPEGAEQTDDLERVVRFCR